MIRVRMDGGEQQLSYEQFIRAIQEGRITSETPVLSEVLTSGVWKPAGQLQFFRSWAPRAAAPERPEPATGEPVGPPPPLLPPPPLPPSPPTPSSPGGPEAWIPYGQASGQQPPPWGGTSLGLPRSPSPSEPIPWEQMEQIGFFAGFGRTVALAFRKVDEFSDRITHGHMLLPPLVFGLLVIAVTALFEAFYSVGALRMFGGMFEEFERVLPRLFGGNAIPTAREILLSHGVRVMFFPAVVFLWGAIVHVGLRVFGRPELPFAATFRIVNYALAPLLLTVVPFCGNPVGWLWVVVLTIRSLARAHRVGGATASAAVLLPMLGFCFWMTVANVGAMLRTLTDFRGSF